ncbi:MAG: hypothetical protein WCD76_10355 [Pyrinomonadaceae bacterium]
MKLYIRGLLLCFALVCLVSAARTTAQVRDSGGGGNGVIILPVEQLPRVVPSSFYFSGQSAPTQMRNSAVARFGDRRHVVAGLVDTSGYSTEVRGKYEGFFITDARITVGTGTLMAGAYGFGFSDDGSLNFYDVGGEKIMSVATSDDKSLARPRPLMMVKAPDGLRLYSGRRFVLVNAPAQETEL